MTLRKKTMIIIGLVLIGLISILCTAVRTILLNSFARLEEQNTRHNVEHVLNTLADDLSVLDHTVEDWAAWDDTYAFIENAGLDYVERNIPDESFTRLRINLMLFVNTSGKVVYGKGFDLKEKKEMPVPVGLQEHITIGSPLVRHPSTQSSITGVLLLPEGPMLVASRPILTTDGKGPVRGALIMGYYLDAREIERLARKTRLSLATCNASSSGMPPDFQTALSSLTDQVPVFVQPLSADSIAGYALLKDIYGKPSLLLRVELPREIYRQGQAVLLYFVLALLSTGLVFSLVIQLLLEKVVLSRLACLSSGINSISASNDLSVRVPVKGRDELSSLAGTVNKMLEALEQSQGDLRESKERYRRLVEICPDAISVLSEGKIVFVNPAGIKLFGATSPAELAGKPFWDFLHPGAGETIKEQLRQAQEHGIPLTEEKLARLDGITIDVEIVAVPFTYQGKPALQAVIRDITERKQMEEQLKYHSLHDPLTGLYNRAYFEQEMRRLESGRYDPFGIIIFDLDGLKIANDTLGHNTGDALLVAAANIIKKSFRQCDIVARIGGDEFAVLLPKSDANTVEQVCQRIRGAIVKYNADNPLLPLSISIGFAVSSESSKNMADLFKEADKNMYREKLHRTQKVRSSIVQALLQTLEEKDFIAEGHTGRLQDLVADLAAAAGLPGHRLNSLRLLAQFHDIGMAGIPDHILLKKGPLTPEETTGIQRHCEIGYRIAQFDPALMPIADWILKHHEWWNGEGYPLGLKGTEIPLECRILAIADAYYIMTSDRPYRKAMSHEEAVAELRRCAGAQFDPQLVQKFLQVLENRHIKRGNAGRTA